MRRNYLVQSRDTPATAAGVNIMSSVLFAEEQRQTLVSPRLILRYLILQHYCKTTVS